jgi:glycosyltransferase involved in cell wall biosynthesis
VLLQAAARVVDRHPDVDFFVAGPPQRGYERHHAQLLKLRDELGLSEHFHFLGAIEDVGALWSSADVYCQPSRAEPFGLGILEAWSLGKPVVVTKVGGMAEIVDEDRYGVRVPSEDPAALAEGLCAVLGDDAYAARIAEAGRERLNKHYSLDSMLDRLLAEYAAYGVGAA